MMAADKRPLWLVQAELPTPLTIELWSAEAQGKGFTEMQAAMLCYWKWLVHIDPARVERWERTEDD